MQIAFPFFENRPPKQNASDNLDAKTRIEALHVLSRIIARAGKRIHQPETDNDRND